MNKNVDFPYAGHRMNWPEDGDDDLTPHPTPDRLPFKFDELAVKLEPWPRRIRLVVACLIAGPVLVGALVALVYAWI